MNGNSGQREQQTDEIDLLALLERSIRFIKQYRWVFLTAAILGLLLGLIRYLSLPTVYKSRLILHSFILTNQNDIQIVANWNALLKSGDYQSLASVFNMTPSALKKVKQIKAEEIQKVFTPTNPNGFTIEVYVTEIDVLDPLQEGIVYGFDNSDYVKDRLAAKKEKLEELITITGQEIRRLDSTKELLEKIISGQRPNPSSLIVDGSGIHRQWLEMNEKLLAFEEELKFTRAVQVLQGFGKFKKPAGPNLFLWLFLGLASGISIAYAIALFRSINTSLRKREANKKIRRAEILGEYSP